MRTLIVTFAQFHRFPLPPSYPPCVTAGPQILLTRNVFRPTKVYYVTQSIRSCILSSAPEVVVSMTITGHCPTFQHHIPSVSCLEWTSWWGIHA